MSATTATSTIARSEFAAESTDTGSRRRHRATRRLGALAVAAGAAGLVLVAGTPAFAAGTYHTTTSVHVRTGPGTSYPIIATVANDTSFTLLCQWQGGTDVGGNSTWDKARFANGTVGAISDDLTSTPSYNSYAPGTGGCSTPPPTGTAKVGRTVSYNEGTSGQCTWWAINEFHAFSGYYPDFTSPSNNGNAEYWAGNAARDGWTVTATPRVDSVVVFPPYVNGADSVGHVAWVTAVNGSTITFTEMNATAGPGRVDSRTVTPASSVRYILAP